MLLGRETLKGDGCFLTGMLEFHFVALGGTTRERHAIEHTSKGGPILCLPLLTCQDEEFFTVQISVQI